MSRRPLSLPAFALALALLALVSPPSFVGAQALAADSLRARLDAYRAAHDVDILRELRDFVAMPNVASNGVDIRRNADHLLSMLTRRGIPARLLESPAGAPPAVYGELLAPGAAKTVVFYAHYDGQPVDAAQWLTPPWSPVLRDKPHNEGGQIIPFPSVAGSARGDWRLYGRSTSDDKAPIVAILAAIDALRAVGVSPSVNLKFFFEGEEEAGSGHLRPILERNAELLRADAWLFGDGPVHQSRRQQVVFGVRGVFGVALTAYGPARGLHSGHYGNWAFNPITLLANFIASMRDDDGRILIPYFYDDVAPVTPAERGALAAIPSVDSALRAELRIGATEAHDAPLVERIMLPALNLRGFQGGSVGAAASNTIPTEASASIDFRLVPRQTPQRIRELVESHAADQGFFVVHRDPTPAELAANEKILKLVWEPGYPATRTPMDSPLARAVLRATELASGGPVVALPTLGGSMPMFTFDEVLHVPLIALPIVNHDNSQHAANENLRLQNLWDGIAVYGGVLANLGKLWSQPIP
jgi:acetylornithine deacetylase/succinyl-diaminopimelate desuccinylase-like protein